jgi:hypothetical protein
LFLISFSLEGTTSRIKMVTVETFVQGIGDNDLSKVVHGSGSGARTLGEGAAGLDSPLGRCLLRENEK